jgi:hypothetical protein
MLATVSAGFVLPARARAALPLDPGLAAAGWAHAPYEGLTPARFRPAPGGVTIEGTGAGSFVWRPTPGRAACLTWRWRVDHGPPPTDLTRRGGEDRAISVTVGFSGWPTRASLWQRTQHAVAQARAGAHVLPRSALIYVWGGTGHEPARFYSPWMGGLGKLRALRPAGAPTAHWFEERVDLAADWTESFGGTPPPLQEIAIGSDADDTNARVSAMVENIQFTPCS